MGRLQSDFLERIESYCDRVLCIVDTLGEQNRSRRILDQLTGCGTSIGANLFEADEAMSRKDFCKCLAIANKELNETMFWMRLIARREWVPHTRLSGVLDESRELKSIIGSILTKTRANGM